MQLRRVPLLLGCFLLFATCDSKKTAPTSGPAGQVTEVEGKVSASRAGQEERALKKGNTVFADDTIVTSTDGRVEILLDHNNARWQLAASKERRVDESAAWRAERQELSAFDKTEAVKTVAAGRNSTREAAESKETLLKPDKEGESKTDDDGEGGSFAAPDPQPIAPPTTSATRKKGLRSRKDKRTRRSSGGAPGGGLPKPADTRTPAPLPLPTATGPLPSPAPTPPPDPAQTQKSFVRKLLLACHRKHGGKGSIRYSLSGKAGKVAKLKISGEGLDGVVACLRSRLASATLPNDEAISGTVRLGSE